MSEPRPSPPATTTRHSIPTLRLRPAYKVAGEEPNHEHQAASDNHQYCGVHTCLATCTVEAQTSHEHTRLNIRSYPAAHEPFHS